MPGQSAGSHDKRERMSDERGTLEAMVRNAAAREAEHMQSVNINTDAALYRTAQEQNLGAVKTDEIRMAWQGKEYVVQGFTEAILYTEDGNWESMRRIEWGTTKDAAEHGKTEGAIEGGEPGISLGGTAAGAGRGDRGSGLTEG